MNVKEKNHGSTEMQVQNIPQPEQAEEKIKIEVWLRTSSGGDGWYEEFDPELEGDEAWASIHEDKDKDKNSKKKVWFLQKSPAQRDAYVPIAPQKKTWTEE